jgi:short-subunit dehydrogenase
MEQQGKYALITGATAGIGFELARLFAQDQYNLIIVSRDQTSLDTTANELMRHNIEVLTIAKDLFDRDSAFQLYQ